MAFWKCDDGSLETFNVDEYGDTKSDEEIHTYRIHSNITLEMKSKKTNFGPRMYLCITYKRDDGQTETIYLCKDMGDISQLISWMIKTYKDLK